MRNRLLGSLAAAAFLLCAVLVAPARPAVAAEVTDEQVERAIEKAVDWLYGQQLDNGRFSKKGYFSFGEQPPDKRVHGAHTVMAMLGLTFAREPISDERMLKGFDAMLEVEMDRVYTVSPRIMVCSRLLRKLDRERQYKARQVLKRDIEWLLGSQNKKGAWGYGAVTPEDYGWDYSNTQFAVLALSEAHMAGLELPREPFFRVQQLYLDRQRDDGGWNYGMRGGFQAKDHPDGGMGSYGSMTAAAVATLFITRDVLYGGVGCPCRGQKSGPQPTKLDQAINGGLDFLGKHFTAKRNPLGSIHHWKYYWLYSCERVGLAAGIKYFGEHDWYREGAAECVGSQKGNGSWSDDMFRTSYALCFLVKGRAPILFNKLQFDGEWNNHSRDLSNLTRYLQSQKEQPFNWQVINLQASVPEWHDAPVLYISAETAIEFDDDEQKRKLRQYTDSGGTILFEASCGNQQMVRWWRNLVKELWPEFELKRIDRQHPVFAADVEMRGYIPNLFTMDDGLRTIMFVSQADISCPWNTMAVTGRGDLFQFGGNLFVYASDRRPVRARLAPSRGGDSDAYNRLAVVPGHRPKITLAVAKHGGDWFVARHYKLPERLAAALAGDPETDRLEAAVYQPTRQSDDLLTLEVVGEADAADLDPAKVHVAHLAGRKGLSLGSDAAEKLKAYLAGGGFLLAEAILGDPHFDADFRKAAATLGLELKRLGEDHPILTGDMGPARGYTLDQMSYTSSLKVDRIGKPWPELFGLYCGDRLVGVYSPFDLGYSQAGFDAWGSRGYAPDDARAVLTNILAYVSTRGEKAADNDETDNED